MIIIADNIYDLVNTLKKLSKGAVEADDEDSIDVEFGTVKTVNPLVVDMGQYTVEGEMIAVSGYLKWRQGLPVNNDLRLKTGDTLILIDMGGELWVAIDTVDMED